MRFKQMLKEELREKGKFQLMLEALAVCAFFPVMWGVLMLIDAIHKYQLGTGF